MTHVITNLCIRDGACVNVCPVDCIIPGEPVDEWPLYYIDPETCIDCGACVPECPVAAIFPEDDVEKRYVAQANDMLNMPAGTPGFDEEWDGENHAGEPVHLPATRPLTPGEIVDLTPATEENARYFTEGPGYTARP